MQTFTDLDAIVDFVFEKNKHPARHYTVTTCANTARIERRGYDGYVQRSTQDDQWKAFSDDGYLCGMNDFEDAFRAIQLASELLAKHAGSQKPLS